MTDDYTEANKVTLPRLFVTWVVCCWWIAQVLVATGLYEAGLPLWKAMLVSLAWPVFLANPAVEIILGYLL